jgi:hypothetical protein
MTRRRLVAVVLMMSLAMLVAVAPAVDAHVRWYGGVHIGVGPYWWPYPYYWYPGYGYPGYWHPGPYYAYPPAVVEEPSVYIEMPPPTAYWYYCGPSQAYYPHVETCTEPWIKVPASR